MTILCVDRSLLGLMDLKHKVKAVRPNAVVYGCREPDKALSIAKSEGCDVLLTEIDLGGSQREGLDFALRMQAIHPAVNIIFVTTFEESDFAPSLTNTSSGKISAPRLAKSFSTIASRRKS